MRAIESIELLEGDWKAIGFKHYRRTVTGDDTAVIEVYAEPIPAFGCSILPGLGAGERWRVRYNWQDAESKQPSLSGALTEANGLCRSVESTMNTGNCHFESAPPANLKTENEQLQLDFRCVTARGLDSIPVSEGEVVKQVDFSQMVRARNLALSPK